MTPEEFREAGHRLVDWLADYRAGLEGRPVSATSQPGEIRAQLPQEPPARGAPFDAILRELDQVIPPGLTLWQHPSFFGYFPSNHMLSSVLGDFLSTGLGVLGLSWQSCPALTEFEELTTDWVRQMLGLSTAWRGVIQDTASSSTLVALLCARERSSDFCMTRGGMQAQANPLTVYVSGQAHSSVLKAALLAGFGRDHVRSIPHDASFAMRSDALDEAIRHDRAEGSTPCAVVATSGTTATTAFDPLREIAAVAKRHGVWMHVDATMAGSAMILPECRSLWDGVEGADSVVVNAHKWLGAAFDCSLYFARDPEHLVRVMSTNPSYLQSSQDGRVTNYRDWGIPLGRRFRALKLWCLIRAEGVEGLQARLRRDLQHAERLASMVASTPGWRVVAPVPLQTVCVRHEPPGVDGEDLDAHTLAWVDRVNRSGTAYLTPAMLEGRWMARVSIGSEATEWRHVERLWDQIRLEAERAPAGSDRAEQP